MLKIIILLTGLTGLLAQASTPESCSSVRLSEKRIGPIRNQGISGLCFAYEGADLLTYKLGYRVSALDVALYYLKFSSHKKISDVYANGGDTLAPLNNGARMGFCSEQSLASDEDRVDFSETPHAKIYDSLMWLEKHGWKTDQSFLVAQSIFSNLSYSHFQTAADIKNEKARFNYLQRVVCPEKTALSNIKLEYREAARRSEVPALIETVNQQLQKNNITGIGFHSNDLYSIKDTYDNHATTIIGRRWNSEKNRCEYLMRDNFGSQCEVYEKGLECEGGNIWLSEKFLLKNLYEVEYLK